MAVKSLEREQLSLSSLRMRIAKLESIGICKPCSLIKQSGDEERLFKKIENVKEEAYQVAPNT